MADLPIKDLGQSLTITNDAEFVYTQPNGSANTTYKAPITQLGGKLIEDMTFSNLTTTSKNVEGAINELNGKWLTGTLAAGSTGITFQDSAITTSSIVDNIFTDVWGVNPTNVVVTTGQIEITFSAQLADVSVKVRIL